MKKMRSIVSILSVLLLALCGTSVVRADSITYTGSWGASHGPTSTYTVNITTNSDNQVTGGNAIVVDNSGGSAVTYQLNSLLPAGTDLSLRGFPVSPTDNLVTLGRNGQLVSYNGIAFTDGNGNSFDLFGGAYPEIDFISQGTASINSAFSPGYTDVPSVAQGVAPEPNPLVLLGSGMLVLSGLFWATKKLRPVPSPGLAVI